MSGTNRDDYNFNIIGQWSVNKVTQTVSYQSKWNELKHKTRNTRKNAKHVLEVAA